MTQEASISGRRHVLMLVLVAAFGLAAPFANAREEREAEVSTQGSDDSRAPFGVGLVFGYEWGLPLSHRISAGVILGDARTSGGGGGGGGYDPWFSIPGGGGRGLLLQAEIGARAVKLSAGYADAQMWYLPPVSWGWAIKASYLEPHESTETFRSGKYLGAELEFARVAKFSIGVFQGLDADRGTLVTWGVGIGF